MHDVNLAVARAQEEMRAWSSAASARAAAMTAWADALEADVDRLADLIVGEVGKIRAEAHREVLLSADALRYNAGEARRLDGRAGRLDDSSLAFVERVPVGVTAFIVPWNTPVLLLVRDLAPALAAGVTAVVKPSPLAPLSIEHTIRLGRDAGVPPDVVQVLHGDARTGAHLVSHPTVRAVAFTGSVEVGRAVLRAAAADFTRVLLELGGKGVSVIHHDADIDVAVRESVRGACFTSGQMCMAVTRVLAERSIFEEVVGAVVEHTRAVTVGDPRDPATDMGPLITNAHQARVQDYVELARREARVLCGGDPPADLDGPYLRPAVITGVRPESRLVQEEIFGPVLMVEPFDGDTEAVALANASPFGLTASIWTRDLDRAWRVGRQIDTGTVWINRFGGLYAEVPFGGMKSSGLGRTRGSEGLRQFTDVRVLNWRPA
ncbi:acyl-CoA reductase-like NAD-dependent aldehyde dehydrogenase [Kibdelosporangium phytohabitans]|nr:acyl-CoA reductase-like NAD-dependent aldehyde dehydrogenase [Kibdelosporangium phytohabitans]